MSTPESQGVDEELDLPKEIDEKKKEIYTYEAPWVLILIDNWLIIVLIVIIQTFEADLRVRMESMYTWWFKII